MPAGRGVVMAKPATALPLTLPQAILAQTPVGYWKLDETSGTTAIDYSGNARDGTYSGAVTLADTLGPDGIMYPTWAAGGRVTIPHNVAWSQTGIGITVFMVTKPTTVASNRFLMEKGMDGAKEWIWQQRFVVTGGSIETQLATMRPTSGGSAVKASYTTNGGLVPAVWNVNAGTMFGTGSTGVFQHFRGSSVPAHKTDTVITGSVTNGVGLLYIGDDPSTSPTNTFIGQICHVAIFQGVLTRAQIKVIMDAARNDGWLDATYDDQEVVQPVTYEIDTVVNTPVADVLVGSDANVSQALTYELDAIAQTTVAESLTPEDGSAVQPVTYSIKTVADTPVRTFDTLPAAIVGLTPLGYWKLNDAGTTAVDSSGNGRNSSTTNFWVQQNAQGYFDRYGQWGSASTVPIPDNAVWTPGASGLSIFFLTRVTSYSSTAKFVAKGASTQFEWFVEQSGAAGALRCAITNPTESTVFRQVTSNNGVIALNTWQAFVITISGNTDAANIEMYKNDNTPLAKASNTSAGAGTVTNGTGVLAIGNRSPFSLGLTGSMAHVAVFSGVLSGANITTLMSAADADGWF